MFLVSTEQQNASTAGTWGWFPQTSSRHLLGALHLSAHTTDLRLQSNKLAPLQMPAANTGKRSDQAAGSEFSQTPSLVQPLHRAEMVNAHLTLYYKRYHEDYRWTAGGTSQGASRPSSPSRLLPSQASRKLSEPRPSGFYQGFSTWAQVNHQPLVLFDLHLPCFSQRMGKGIQTPILQSHLSLNDDQLPSWDHQESSCHLISIKTLFHWEEFYLLFWVFVWFCFLPRKGTVHFKFDDYQKLCN